jgi:lipopolysaccharide export LptBFGC system permease protein LptF
MQTETDDERRMLTQTLAWSVAFVVASAALLILPPLSNYGNGVRGWYVVMTLVPQAAPLAIPMGIAFGLAIGATGRMALKASTVLLLVATVASLLSFVMLAWGMPAGNEAFREIAFRQISAEGHDGQVILQKGHNEMTFSELRREIAVLSAAGQPRQARQFAFSLHLRFSLAAATLALTSVLLAVRTKRRGLRVLIAAASCLAYWMLLYAGDAASLRGYVTPPIGAWLPNLMMIASAMFIASSRSSRLRGLRLRVFVV